jgi:sugar phosphate isomerase/epimerase
MISRRDLGKIMLGALPLARAYAGIDSTIQGVRIGASGYSFQHLGLDAAILAMKEIGLGACEVWYRHIEPKAPREELRAWRLSAPLDTFRAVGTKYRQTGIDIVAFTFDMKDDFTDAELNRVFEMTEALGARRIACSATFTVAQRLVPLMAKYRIEVAFHGHTDAADPNQLAGPESFRKVLAMSPYAKINLDIGQFVAAGFDPLPFVVEQHANIPMVHIRDGSPEKGTKLSWGTGTTPIRQVLQLLKRKRYPIVADIEYDYGGAADPVTEVAKCFSYCRDALA